MNDKPEDASFIWENDEVKIEIPYSVAGISTSIAITSKFTGKILLLDVGDGILRDLVNGCCTDFVNDLDVIAITHGHFDHIGGIYSLLGFLRMLGRTEPLNILIPSGCVELPLIVQAFRYAYSGSLPFRIFLHELGDKTEFDTDFFKIRAFEVEHFGLENTTDDDRLMPALGYRVNIGLTQVGYTGDTRLCENAENVVRDVDVAIIEATRRSPPKTNHRVHLTIEEAQQIASLAKDHILIHKMPAFIQDDVVN